MLARLDELEGELKTLLEALRRSGERLNEGLAQLQRQVGEFGAEVAPTAPGDDRSAAPAADLAAADEDLAPLADELTPAADDVAAEPASSARNGDEAGARLIALNMALSGTPREETAAYLAEHYDLADPEALLDDVYSRADR
jgi:hypothetical protein